MTTDPLLRYRLHGRLRSHQRLVERTREAISVTCRDRQFVVSTSWGKDSLVLVDLCRTVMGRDIDLLHMASPHRLPGDDLVIQSLTDGSRYHVRAGLELADYLTWIRDVGLPHERTASEQQRAVHHLKKDPATAWCIAHGFELQLLGMRAEENPRTRGKLFRHRGPRYRLASGIEVFCPLAWWSAVDVWAYIAEHELPYNHRIYDSETHGYTRETIRNAGWLSTDSAQHGRIAWLRQHFPREFYALNEQFPSIRAYL